jgi:branched-chain amino acid transport system substrate-binding protein
MKRKMAPLIVAVLVIVSFCLVTVLNDTAAAAAKKPIKIGLLTALSGGLAALGEDCRNGFMLYVKEKGSVFAGHPIEVIIEDTTGVASVAVTKARKLIDKDGVDLLVGPLTGAEGYAVGDLVRKTKTIDFSTAGSDALTKWDKSPYVLRNWVSSSGPSHPFADYAFNELGWRTVALCGTDYAYPHEGVGGFHYRFQELGGKVVKRVWTPPGAPDYGPYIPQLPKDVDGIFAVQAGGDAIRFVEAYATYGFKGKVPLAGHWNVTDEGILDAEGDNAIGIITTGHYAAKSDTPENKEFVKKYQAAYGGRMPSMPSEGLYSVAQSIEATLQLVGEAYKDPLKFAKAFRNIKIVSPRGTITVDDYNMVIQPTVIRKVEKVGGKLQNTPIHVIPDTSQWGPYDPIEYMKRPRYSRDWPPVK